MYVPAHFAPPTDDTVTDLLGYFGAAELITMTGSGLLATLLPMVYDVPSGSTPQGRLRGHLARPNTQWSTPPTAPALVIVHGPDAYVSPSWYASKAEHGRVVPTWNYVTAHVYGSLVVHDDADWVSQNVRDLTAKHEAGRSPEWTVDDAPPAFTAGMLCAIVGVEIVIDRIEAKFKLSQNRPGSDVDGVIAGLSGEGKTAAAEAVRAARPAGAQSPMA